MYINVYVSNTDSQIAVEPRTVGNNSQELLVITKDCWYYHAVRKNISTYPDNLSIFIPGLTVLPSPVYFLLMLE